jgi:hypothetical protein
VLLNTIHNSFDLSMPTSNTAAHRLRWEWENESGTAARYEIRPVVSYQAARAIRRYVVTITYTCYL